MNPNKVKKQLIDKIKTFQLKEKENDILEKTKEEEEKINIEKDFNNDFNNSVSNYFISAFSSSLLQKDIIARINLTYIQQQQGVYQTGQDDGLSTQINRQRSYFGPVDIERLEIKLLDEFGRIIDLNKMDWSMALTMECLYDT